MRQQLKKDIRESKRNYETKVTRESKTFYKVVLPNVANEG